MACQLNQLFCWGLPAIVVGAVLIIWLTRRRKGKSYPPNVVILHQVGRGPYAPSIVPFAVKLETYLRMANIPYQNEHGMQRSAKGKFPWIEYNGETVADSTLCISYLNKKFDINLNSHLIPRDRGVALAWQLMAEEHMYWCFVLFRWVFSKDTRLLAQALGTNRLVVWLLGRKLARAGWKQGMGRHSSEEVMNFFKKDLQALEDYLGNQKFLMGSEPCETDCAVFGQLSQINWQLWGTGNPNLVADKYPNLSAYCERMKTTFWPDWDECITHGGTREATE